MPGHPHFTRANSNLHQNNTLRTTETHNDHSEADVYTENDDTDRSASEISNLPHWYNGNAFHKHANDTGVNCSKGFAIGVAWTLCESFKTNGGKNANLLIRWITERTVDDIHITVTTENNTASWNNTSLYSFLIDIIRTVNEAFISHQPIVTTPPIVTPKGQTSPDTTTTAVIEQINKLMMRANSTFARRSLRRSIQNYIEDLHPTTKKLVMDSILRRLFPNSEHTNLTWENALNVIVTGSFSDINSWRNSRSCIASINKIMYSEGDDITILATYFDELLFGAFWGAEVPKHLVYSLVYLSLPAKLRASIIKKKTDAFDQSNISAETWKTIIEVVHLKHPPRLHLDIFTIDSRTNLSFHHDYDHVDFKTNNQHSRKTTSNTTATNIKHNKNTTGSTAATNNTSVNNEKKNTSARPE